jgi:hypothetical protein
MSLRTRRAARVQGGEAREGPLVGGARSRGRVGVRDGLQARRGRGGAAARGVIEDVTAAAVAKLAAAAAVFAYGSASDDSNLNRDKADVAA